jgi:hypothetical protein
MRKRWNKRNLEIAKELWTKWQYLRISYVIKVNKNSTDTVENQIGTEEMSGSSQRAQTKKTEIRTKRIQDALITVQMQRNVEGIGD